MTGTLDEHVVLVSGSGPGLGASTGAAILAQGGRVVLTDVVPDRAEQTRESIDPDGDRSVAVRADITDEAACAEAIEVARREFGRLDGVVNIAAYDTALGGLLDESTFDDWERAAAVNVAGTLRLTKAAIPLIQEGGRGGSIVIIGSTSAVRPRRTTLRLAYGMSKGALSSGAYFLAEELGPEGIRVNTVAPGFKYGPLVETWFQTRAEELGTTAEEIAAFHRSELALRRFATDEDVANAAVFFLSDNSRAITGQTLYVDGGFVMP